MNEKKLLDNWAEYVKHITCTTSTQPDDSPAVIEARRTALEANPEAWMTYYFPSYTFAEPAPFHLAATQRLLTHREWYEVRLWSRELAKSTRTMMEVLYLMLVGHPPQPDKGIPTRLLKKYVLVISNSLDNAIRLLQPYKTNLEHNKRIVQDYGIQENAGKWQASEFTTLQGASFRALGAGQSPRGTRKEEARPDLLLFDDIDTDADCLSPDLIAKKWRWIEEAAIGTRSVSAPTTIIFCGNRIARDCCIARATQFADYTDEVNIRNAHGHSTWLQKNTEDHINRVLSQKSYAAAQKEYFNNPVTEGAVFQDLPLKPPLPLDQYEAIVCYTDPSYKETNDYKATVLIGKHQAEYHILQCYVAQTTIAQMLEWHIAIMEYLNGTPCYFYMEAVFLQDIIIKQLNDMATEHGIHLYIREDKRTKPHKYTRIESLLEPLYRNGNLYISQAEAHSPQTALLQSQFKAFAPGSTAHDDAPDAVEGAIWLLLQHTKPLHLPQNLPKLKREAMRF
ncbi:MAG: hypothetical protein EBX41_03700 [Chitinophagia bacterium]|nr:hypothetical protein [Chitinophagia bacterium]